MIAPLSSSIFSSSKLVREIEVLINTNGLYAVTLALAETCYRRADRICFHKTYWKDRIAARRWYRAGARIEKAYRALLKIQLSYGD